MKLSVGVLLSIFVAIHGASVGSGETYLDGETLSGKINVPASLFDDAWDFQSRLETLQSQINTKLSQVRTAISGVLKTSSWKTLEQIETNARHILELDFPARNLIFADNHPSICNKNLRVLIDSITEFTGFGSSNAVTSYDRSVQGALQVAFNILQQYEGSSVDVQQIVVRSFIGKNAFLQPGEIAELFKTIYYERLNEWNASYPHIEEFVNDLDGKIDGFNKNLKRDFALIQEQVAPAYVVLAAEIATCEEFDRTTDPFAIFRNP